MALRTQTFTKTVTTAGTRERLTERDISVPAVLIQAISTNTNDVYVGNDTVSNSQGIEIDARDAVYISAKDLGWAEEKISLREMWIDADTNGEGVNVMYLERI